MKGRTIEDAAIVMTDEDTVATTLSDLGAGRSLDLGDRSVRLTEDVAFGHKFALGPIDAGDAVVKYGEVIGEATTAIEAGEWVHTHNVESRRARPDEGSESDENSQTAQGGASE